MTRRFTFLGTGTSTGVPALACDCAVCRSTDPRNRRNRPAALITSATCQNILIDTPPELRVELLHAGIDRVHATLFTHYHADHLFGLDDLRQFPRHLGGPMPVYCADDVEAVIRKTFAYIFPADGALTTTYLPKLEFTRIRPGEVFYVFGERVLPIELVHAQFRTIGFRFGDLAYCTDLNRIPEISLRHLQNLDTLVIGALRYKPHPAHMSLDEVLATIEQLAPRRSFLTHLSHDFDHDVVNESLPDNVWLGFDGMSFDF